MKGNYDEVETFHDGEIVFREGEQGHALRIVQRGAVEVLKKVGDKEVILAVLERGSFFGEMSLLEAMPHGATVRAKGETRLLVILPGSLLLKIRRDPTFAIELMQQMSRRIRSLNERLAAAMRDTPGIDPVGRAAFARAAAEFYTVMTDAKVDAAKQSDPTPLQGHEA